MSNMLRHIGIIMDGNGRWAKQRGLPRQAGHEAGVDVAKKIVLACRERNIPVLTLYTFSKENWKRPEQEVVFLFKQLYNFFTAELGMMIEKSIQIRVLGVLSDLPITTRMVMSQAIAKTQHCSGMVLNLALSYSGRDEILHACRQLLQERVTPEALTPELFAEKLHTAGQPDPDLIIRTSGEQRISNFLLYQSAYAEYYFTETLWPDFTPAHLDEILAAYSQRVRRFGSAEEESV